MSTKALMKILKSEKCKIGIIYIFIYIKNQSSEFNQTSYEPQIRISKSMTVVGHK